MIQIEALCIRSSSSYWEKHSTIQSGYNAGVNEENLKCKQIIKITPYWLKEGGVHPCINPRLFDGTNISLL